MKIVILDTTQQRTSHYGRLILEEIFNKHGEDVIAILTSKQKNPKKRSYYQRIKYKFQRVGTLIFIDYFYKLISLAAGRKLSWKYSEVEEYHDFKSQFSVPVYEFDRINSIEVREFILENEVDIAYHSGGMIIRPIILDAPKIGVLGYHHGDIQKYRGPFQCFWELYNDEKFVGVTLQILKSKLDTGPIIHIEHYPIPEKMSLKELQRITNWSSVNLGALAISKLKDPNFSPLSNYELGVYRSYPSLLQVLRMILKGKI